MARIKLLAILGLLGIYIKGSDATSIEFFLGRPLAVNNQNQSVQTTPIPTISERIQNSLNNVLRLPLPGWSSPGSGSATPPRLQRQPSVTIAVAPQQILQTIAGGGAINEANTAIHSTIAQLSTLSHWPFGYVTTAKPGQPAETSASVMQYQPPPPPPPPPPPTTTTTTTTTTPRTTTTTTTPPPPPPPPPTQPPAPPAPSPPRQTFTPSPLFQSFIPSSGAGLISIQNGPSQSISNRLQNRFQSTFGNFVRLPGLPQLGPRPRPMLTEPPWVTELLGPTLEPPTTRIPSLGERVQSVVSNALLFVPATLLNFWYENWGTQQVDRIIQRLQVSTPKPAPGAVVDPVFATISQNINNPFANFTPSANFNTSDLPAIAAFINQNGTLMPTIVHPVVNKTTNTIEYQLRSENETTVLWTGSLNNDLFFRKKPAVEVSQIDTNTNSMGSLGWPVDSEDDEDEQIKSNVLNIKL